MSYSRYQRIAVPRSALVFAWTTGIRGYNAASFQVAAISAALCRSDGINRAVLRALLALLSDSFSAAAAAIDARQRKMAAHQLDDSARPPEPEFVLRGPLARRTALRFLDEHRLVSGDVGGHCLLWNLATRRPVQNWAAAPLGVLELHAHAGGLLTQTRDGRIRLWDLENLAEPTTTLATNSFFFARCATVGHGEDYAAPPIIKSTETTRPTKKAESGIGAQLASDDDEEEETPPPVKRWCDQPGHARHLVLAPTEPPEATLLWDTRQSQPALKLAPDAGDRTLVRKGDASVLGNAMAMRLWLPQSQPSSKPPLALVGHENGRILAWDLAMPVPQICAKTPQNSFSSPNVALDVNRGRHAALRGRRRSKSEGVSRRARVAEAPRGARGDLCCCERTRPAPGRRPACVEGGRQGGSTGAGWDYRVRLFSAKSLRRFAVLRYHDASVNALDWSSDMLATGSKDTKVASGGCRFDFCVVWVFVRVRG